MFFKIWNIFFQFFWIMTAYIWLSYVGIIIFVNEEHFANDQSNIATKEVGKNTLPRLSLSTLTAKKTENIKNILYIIHVLLINYNLSYRKNRYKYILPTKVRVFTLECVLPNGCNEPDRNKKKNILQRVIRYNMMFRKKKVQSKFILIIISDRSIKHTKHTTNV